MTLGIFIPFFWFNNNASPLGTSIEVTFVYADNTPIVGLHVELYDGVGFFMEADTNADGIVLFAGLVDETYTWHWSWQNIPDQRSEEITCSEIDWTFDQTLAYWTLEKTFYYDTVPPTPVGGLEVILRDPYATQIAVPLDTQTTDADGLVTFVGLKAGDYTIEWMWDSELQIETVPTIEFQTPTPVVMDINYLESKSGGG